MVTKTNQMGYQVAKPDQVEAPKKSQRALARNLFSRLASMPIPEITVPTKPLYQSLNYDTTEQYKGFTVSLNNLRRL